MKIIREAHRDLQTKSLPPSHHGEYMKIFSMGKNWSPEVPLYKGIYMLLQHHWEGGRDQSVSTTASLCLLPEGFYKSSPQSFRNACVQLVTSMLSTLLSTCRTFLSLSSGIIRKHFCAVRKPFGAFRKAISERLLIVTAIILLSQIFL